MLTQLKRSFGAKQINDLLAFLIPRRRSLLPALFSQFLFQAALTIAVQLGFVPVFAQIPGDVVFVGKISRHNQYLAECLEQNADQGYYGNYFFQKDTKCEFSSKLGDAD